MVYSGFFSHMIVGTHPCMNQNPVEAETGINQNPVGTEP
jgi:hypothetical protein